MQKVLLYTSLTLLVALIVVYNFKINHNNDPICGHCSPVNGVASMPLVQDTNPITTAYKTAIPIPQRGEEFRQYLAASVRIQHNGTAGSGTIIFYDRQENWAYIMSCGHLWDGSRSASQLQRSPVSSEITVWYHNQKKLDSPKNYHAEVLFWSNVRGSDCSLLRFRPDWIPNYFPIAPINFDYNTNIKQHSLGCDHATEVAHYEVEIVGMRGVDLITRYNSPRPGRSGGGLLTSNGFYIGVCWGTSDEDGSGIGYFTPLTSIHRLYTENGYQWLLAVGRGQARNIPIVDREYPGQKFPVDYIPLPENGVPLPN